MVHKDTTTCDPNDSCEERESRDSSEESEEGGASDTEVGGGFSGIRMQSVKDIIARAKMEESFLKSGTETGENLEELAKMIQEPKEEDGTVCVCVYGVYVHMCCVVLCRCD